jgi:predicted flap endonuclease-1-like 5' DNA nuclease
MALPTMTPEQRAEGLAKAAETRKAQSELLGKVKAGDVALAEVLASTDPVTARIRVKRALQAVPGVGPAKATAALGDAGIQENRRVGGLTPGQRERLLAQFGA